MTELPCKNGKLSQLRWHLAMIYVTLTTVAMTSVTLTTVAMATLIHVFVLTTDAIHFLTSIVVTNVCFCNKWTDIMSLRWDYLQ